MSQNLLGDLLIVPDLADQLPVSSQVTYFSCFYERTKHSGALGPAMLRAISSMSNLGRLDSWRAEFATHPDVGRRRRCFRQYVLLAAAHLPWHRNERESKCRGWLTWCYQFCTIPLTTLPVVIGQQPGWVASLATFCLASTVCLPSCLPNSSTSSRACQALTK